MNSNSTEILKRLKKHYPEAKIALNYSSPIEILVATILSAQCTDKQVNKVTEAIFKKYKSAKDYASADIKEFEQEIKSTGFYHNKAKNIVESAKIIVTKHGRKVPDTMNNLLTLPGVARKTANIVLGNAYNIVEGIPVDTHVKRLSQRLGLSNESNPEKIEQDLMHLFKKKQWYKLSYLLIEHGRNTCNAKKPLCDKCFLKDICPKKDYK
ncbi:MAG: endonuclease III [Elusimicrobia bacterium RIFOXYA2_FULL_39_19]|nr:MAG: endonuclease III [Elusimicrobia bacterium RIFOXYA2_FULL_39_19]